MPEKGNVFRLHLIAAAAHVGSQVSSIESRMGLDSKESHRGTALRAGRMAELVAVGRDKMVHGAGLSSISSTIINYTLPY